MFLEKADFKNLLTLIHRVEVKGLAEAAELVSLAKKLMAHIEAPESPTPAPQASAEPAATPEKTEAASN